MSWTLRQYEIDRNIIDTLLPKELRSDVELDSKFDDLQARYDALFTLLNWGNDMMKRLFEIITYFVSIAVFFVAMTGFSDYIGMGFPKIFVPMLISLFSIGFLFYSSSLLLHFINNQRFSIKQYMFVFIVPLISVFGQIAIAMIWLIDRSPYSGLGYSIIAEDAFQLMCLFLTFEVLSFPTMIHVIVWNFRQMVYQNSSAKGNTIENQR